MGGDNTENVTTISHSFSNPEREINIVWTRPGGGHYESVIPRVTNMKVDEATEGPKRNIPVCTNDTASAAWRFTCNICKNVFSRKVRSNDI